MLVVLNSGDAGTSSPTPTPTPAPVTPSISYNRNDYLTDWVDADGDCQDARQEVLIAESVVPVTLSSDGCRVLAGLWQDDFTGLSFNDPGDLDIDHLVPLKEAHDSGAWLWSPAAKKAYSNNLSNPLVLNAVDNSANRSKGDRDPALWMPSNTSYHCEYIKSWVAVKQAFGLSMDNAEAKAISTILNLTQYSATSATRMGVALSITGTAANQSTFSVGMTQPGVCGYLREATPSSSVTLAATVTPDPAHVGQQVDVVVIAQLGEVLVMKNTEGQFVPWNLSLETLQPAIKAVTLGNTLDFEIVSGILGLHGKLNVFLGYMTQMGELVYSLDPLSFDFTPTN